MVTNGRYGSARAVLSLAAALAAVALAWPSAAQGNSPEKPGRKASASSSVVWLPVSAAGATAAPSHPVLHHAPVSTAKPHEALAIAATIEFPNLVKRAVVRYRLGGGAPAEVPFLRGSGDEYVASIPEDAVRPPGLSYAIEIEETTGAKIDAFGASTQMQDVRVDEDIDDLRERALLAQVDGRRSVVSSSFDYVMFGKVQPSGTSPSNVDPVSDSYFRTEAVYTYRPLRFIVEFSIRVGAVRGTSPIPGYDPVRRPDDDKVGLNYGAPTVIMRLHDSFHLEASALTSVTEQGFSSGVGAALHIGEIYGSKLVLGFETVKTFGSRGYARLDLVRQRFRVSPIIEVTDMPHADRAGIRLLTEVAFKLGDGFAIAARGGYQARDFKTGGPGLGLSFSYAF